jgi:pyruvate/2-oxoglutarate dehydrogenase complex dihydrolipoamide dehydrogenase (E3) component/uncharacterized membrane protein YdjX (TVP38/TMEM64 family)
LLLAAVVALVVAFFAFDLDRYFSLDSIKARQAEFAALYASRPLSVIGVYALIYVVVFALALPVGAAMTLIGGALFGTVVGTVVVSFASTIGATFAFLAARYLFADSVRKRFGSRLAEVDRGMAQEGAFYLFTLRLIPVFPPAAINLLFGLTKMRVPTFYWVSQLGMLLGTIVYVNAGTQLAQLQSLSGILSPALIGSFVLLGMLPLVTRRIVVGMRSRKVYSRWSAVKPKRFDRNLVVIGAGAAGLIASYIAAVVKAKVTLVESHKMGGDCLNYGCVPSKALIKTATLVAQMRRGSNYGIEATRASFRFGDVMDRIAGIIRAIEPHDSPERYRALGVDVVQGHARIVDPWRVQITDAAGTTQTLTTKNIVIATGAAPFVPPLPGLEEVGYLTSDTLWDLRELPERLVVLGGGPVGCELAQCFARLGSQVTVIEILPRLMVREDEEVSALVRAALESDGATVLCGHTALRCEQEGGAKFIVVEADGVEQRIGFDVLLCAVGRNARLTSYGLEELGIPVGRTIETNEYLQTIYPNILACGDVAGPFQLTHAGSHQAWYASVNALFGGLRKFRADYSVLPWCTFTDPEVARVGLNEQEANERQVAYEVTRYDIGELDRAIADSAAHGFVKVLTVPGKDRILGVTIVGSSAGDTIAEYVLAMRHRLGLNKISGTIHIYPTLAEANKSVANEWRRLHQPHKLLEWVAKYHAWLRG